MYTTRGVQHNDPTFYDLNLRTSKRFQKLTINFNPLSRVKQSNINRKTHLTLAASRLRELDGAFVLRSDLRWTYAVVARVILPEETVDDGNIHRCRIEFIVSKAGATKSVSYGGWARGVRAIRHPDGEEVDESYCKLRSLTRCG